MSRTWKPGDVAMVEVGCHANRHVAISTGEGWRYGDDKWVASDPAIVSVRPLVTIDPENREEAERLAEAWVEDCRVTPLRDPAERMQTVLREYANPTPPKPEEPTGLGAVVEDAEGEQWVRSRHEAHQWIPALRGRGLVFCAWDEIDAMKVLSEGVTA